MSMSCVTNSIHLVFTVISIFKVKPMIIYFIYNWIHFIKVVMDTFLKIHLTFINMISLIALTQSDDSFLIYTFFIFIVLNIYLVLFV